jgi:hypothetical protein
MAFGLLFVRGFCVVNDGDKSVSVLSDIEDHVAIYIIGILVDGILPHLGRGAASTRGIRSPRSPPNEEG